jgi:5-methylcytosine-specific restriction endonuclease McrA
MIPTAAPRPCPSCRRALITRRQRLCDPCRRDGERARRAPTLDLYSSARWRRFRRWFLQQSTVCAQCHRPAVAVDHRDPLTADNLATALDPAAVQGLCLSCHAKKTARESGWAP